MNEVATPLGNTNLAIEVLHPLRMATSLQTQVGGQALRDATV
jgi:hypothetical protein